MDAFIPKEFIGAIASLSTRVDKLESKVKMICKPKRKSVRITHVIPPDKQFDSIHNNAMMHLNEQLMALNSEKDYITHDMISKVMDIAEPILEIAILQAFNYRMMMEKKTFKEEWDNVEISE